MARGFVIDLNLSEMDSRNKDSLALNNLGGAGTSSALSLLINNTSNESVMKNSRSYNITNIERTGNQLFFRFGVPIDFRVGNLINITGVTPAEYNLVDARVSVIGTDFFVVDVTSEDVFPAYVSGGVAEGSDFITETIFKTVVGQGTFPTTLFSRRNDEQVVFSNNTRVTVTTTDSESQYVVIDSDGVDSFQLSIETPFGLYNTVNFPNPSDIISITRKDEVTLENISNLNPFRLSTIANNRNQGPSGGGGEFGDGGVLGVSGIDAGDLIPITDRSTLQEIFSGISNNIDLYSFRRRRSVVVDEDAFYDLPITFDGALAITNTSEIDITTEGSPGIFIYNGSDSVRAFSDNSNPWSDTVVGSGYTTTQSTVATVRTLQATRPNFEDLNVVVESGDALNEYTHKIPIRVEDGTGERTYFLLAKLVN